MNLYILSFLACLVRIIIELLFVLQLLIVRYPLPTRDEAPSLMHYASHNANFIFNNRQHVHQHHAVNSDFVNDVKVLRLIVS